MDLTKQGFEKHITKEGLWTKKIKEIMLYVDFRKEEPSVYATKDGDFMQPDKLDEMKEVIEIRSYLKSQKSKDLKSF